MIDNRGPFPRSTVRDLLGVARALYRAEIGFTPLNARRLDTLEKIGRDLRDALELATRCERGSMGRRAAWEKAERATAQLGEFVGDAMPIGPAVRAAGARLSRR